MSLLAGSPDGAPVTWRRLKDEFSPSEPLNRRIFALPEHHLVYVKTAKVGSSTIMAWLSRLHHGDSSRAIANAHTDHGLPRASDLGWADVVMPMLRGDAYRFAFVRDPFRRFESAFHDKIVAAEEEHWRDQVRATLGLGPDVRPDFEAFVTAVSRQDPVREMDGHWLPQHVMLMHPVVTYDRIGRLESFAQDFALVQQEAGVPHIELEVRNVAPSRPRASVYDGRPDLRERVREIYAGDFEAFGYPDS